MKLKSITTLERIAGRLEGLACSVENKNILEGLLDTAEAIDGVIQDESEGDNND